MLNLRKEGLYIANGDKLSILVRVVGKAPMLSILSGVLLNEMYATGKVVTLNEESPEIQDILENPDKYLFLEPSITDVITNSFGMDYNTNLRIEYSKETFKEWVDKYKSINNMCYEKGKAFAKMVQYLSSEFNQSINNAKIIIKIIERTV